MTLLRFADNPILAPTNNWWEQKAVFNPGVTFYRGQVYLLYRALGADGISRLGLAVSSDGKKFQRFDKPLIEGEEGNKFQRLGIEDPRITKIGSRYYITFTEASVYSGDYTEKPAPSISSDTPWRVRVSCISTTNFKSFRHEAVFLPRTNTKDAIIFPEKIQGRYVVLHRIFPDAYISFTPNLRQVRRGDKFFSPGITGWASLKVGAGGPPLKTDKGWLLFFHGVDQRRVYRIGAMLLDLEEPRRIIRVTEKPLLEPERSYEKEGLIPNVVFTCGGLEMGEEIYLYYGAADKVIGLSTVKKAELVKLLS